MWKLTTEKKITKARVKLNDRNPFFGYLTMRLEFERKDDEVDRISVNKFGHCKYNGTFIDSLPQEQIIGAVAHEVMHCALNHFDRMQGKDKQLWNISTDIVINALLAVDGLVPPKNGYNPNGGGYINIWGIELYECHKKSANEVYDKLYNAYKKQEKSGLEEGFDIHIYDDDNQGKEGKKKNKSGNTNDIPTDWEKEIVEAATFAKMQGKLPAGIKRLVNELLGNVIDWRGLLYKYIQSTLPFDYTWIKPNKKSYATGIYMPDVVREQIDIICSIDTSGSISEEELTEFSSELLGIINSFENINLTIIYNDTEVYGPHRLQNPTPSDIIKLKPKGGGGTNHIPVFEWVNKNNENASLLICFTDGYTSYPNNSSIDTIWVLAGHHCDKDTIPFGRVIELPRTH